ncbi:MAG: 50S ribosomal protein L25, partial [Planctomycetes bacterium]|nr:50S ribosomal protein L25 [Planctomycetota bacterium]
MLASASEDKEYDMGFKAIPALKAAARSGVGKNAVAELREAGKVPANLYGKGQDNLALEIDAHELKMNLRLTPALFALELGEGTVHALIKEVQYDIYGQDVLHVDMQRVTLDQKVQAFVPLEFFGTPAGASDGGKLEIVKKNVTLSVTAEKIPDLIRTNTSSLGLGDAITFGDLELPEGA